MASLLLLPQHEVLVDCAQRNWLHVVEAKNIYICANYVTFTQQKNVILSMKPFFASNVHILYILFIIITIKD